jgi:formylglycine-generating enzyme required for sulfatase activity
MTPLNSKKVFISYSSKERAVIETLTKGLELAGFTVWYDRELNRSGGQEWWRKICENLEDSTYFIYALSERSRPDVSEPCKREHLHAKQLGKAILPIRIDTVDPKELPNTFQVAQLLSFSTESVDKAFDAVKSMKESLLDLKNPPELPSNVVELRPKAPLHPTGEIIDLILNLSSDGDHQRLVIMKIEDLIDDGRYAADAPRLLERLLQRDDVLTGRNVNRAHALKEKVDKLPLQLQVISTAPPRPSISPEQAQLIAKLTDHKYPPEQRLTFGDQLAEINDPRPGVGLLPNGLPDFVWCEVPAGPFIMGSAKDIDNPVRTRTLGRFFLAKYAMTVSQYGAFTKSYPDPTYWQGLHADSIKIREAGMQMSEWPIANRPCIRVSWYEAIACGRWITELLQTGQIPNPFGAGVKVEVRIPSEEEWEKGARGDKDNREYPWGDGYRVDHANIDEINYNVGTHYLQQTAPVGMYTQGDHPYGLMDMSGNTREWMHTKYSDTIVNMNRYITDNNNSHVVRGGSWNSDPDHARVSFRHRSAPHSQNAKFGFRLGVFLPVP